jgi:hypothetical protein
MRTGWHFHNAGYSWKLPDFYEYEWEVVLFGEVKDSLYGVVPDYEAISGELELTLFTKHRV